MRTLAKLMLACVLSLLLTTLMAQHGSPSQTNPKFTARTELVTVPVVVLRKDKPYRQLLRQLAFRGQLDEHVTGLTKDDFEIEEDGHPKPIASFEEIMSSNFSIKGTTPPGMFTNQVISDNPVSLVVILVDLINTPYLYQAATKKRLLEYLERDYRGNQPTMLVALHPDGLRILHDFTTDPKILTKLVRRLGTNLEHDPELDDEGKSETSGTLYKEIDLAREYDALEKEFKADYTGRDAYAEQLQRGRLQATFLELQQLSQAVSAVRGMKTLVWATGGFILTNKIVDEYVHTLKLLSAAGIVVYPIDCVMTTDNPGYSSPRSVHPGVGTGMISLRSTLQVVQNFMDISQRTGGDYCLLRKDPDLCFRKAVDYSSRFYMLTYYAQPAKTAEWRKIRVKVRGTNLEVRARSGYFSGGLYGDPDERRKSDIALALATPIEYRGLPISVRWTGFHEEPIPKRAGIAAPAGEPSLRQRRMQSFSLEINPAMLRVDVADDNHIKLDLVAIALDPDAKVLADWTQQIDLHPSAPELERLRRGTLAYSSAVEVPPHTSKVRFLVRDYLNERIGTVSAPIAAQP